MCCTSGFVVYPGPFFVLWILINQSFQSPHPEVGMVSLLYDNTTVQWTLSVQNFKSNYMSTWRQHVRIFLPMSTWKKISTTVLRYGQTKFISKVSVDFNLYLQVMHDYVCWLLCWNVVEDSLWKLLSFHTIMISAYFLVANVLLRGKLWIDVKFWTFDNFESALYMTSLSLPLSLN